jgi:hypothetical protein
MSAKKIDLPTPELDKQSQVIKSGKAQTIEDFIDWLREKKKYHLAEYIYESVEPCQGTRRDPFDPSNCKDGKVDRTITLWTGNKRTGRVVWGDTCSVCGGTGEVTVTYDDPPLVPVMITPEQLMADFFGIDRDEIEKERRALLAVLSKIQVTYRDDQEGEG